MATKPKLAAAAAPAPAPRKPPVKAVPPARLAKPEVAAIAPITSTRENVQEGPALFMHREKVVGAFKIDSATLRGARLEVTGWSAGNCQFQFSASGVAFPQEVTRTSRPDVATALKSAEPEGGFGFVVRARADRAKLDCRLELRVQAGEHVRTFRFPIEVERAALPGATESSMKALGFLEAASSSPLTHDTVVVGWVVHGPEVEVWLENEYGDAYSLKDAYRPPRPDVEAAHGSAFGRASRQAGFIARLEGMMPGEKLKLMAKRPADKTPTVLSATDCGSLDASPAGAARWLFGLGTPMNQLHKRLALVDEPVIERLIEYTREGWVDLPVESRQLGVPLAAPVVSVIVPLYGRSDFVEHQLIEFIRDPWFKANAELVYVLDDPQLVDRFREQAEALYRLYQLPFKWVWGGANRGFSGANNLGASHSRGSHLLFLNSDAFPQQPGWLEDLLDVLAKNPKIGAVGPRLVFADGSIQHAGMQFLRREELGIWINHHPSMGLDPSLDPHSKLTVVPAVTGACLAMRRADYDRIGGWDTGYLIGDFEDSDLCLKLRADGMQVAYQPGIQLTHLERQSFKLLGQGDFRTRVVIYNANRHQTRWRELLGASAQGEGAVA